MPTSDPTAWPTGVPPAEAFRGEDARLTVLEAHGARTLGAAGDPELSEIAQFAARLCDAPIGLVSLVMAETQQFAGRSGIDVRETSRSESFCAHAMMGAEPMQVADAAADPRFADNPLVIGDPHIRFYAGAPLISREGAPLGALCVIDTVPRPAGLTPLQRDGLQLLARAAMRRLHAIRQQRAALSQANSSARAMREVADMLPAIIWTADAEGHFDYFNRRWSEVTGVAGPRTAEEWRPLIHPDDAEATFAAWCASFGEGRRFESSYRLRHADGTWRWTLARGIPQRDVMKNLTRWYGTLTDIDDGQRLSESRDLLARELSHRIKNIFAVIASLISLRARQRPELATFADELNSTIRALGRAHDFVRPVEGVKGDSLIGLLHELMAPYATDADRIRISGEDCQIGPRAATPLALVFHELATNAAKYGALSVEHGKVAIACETVGDTVRICWLEQGASVGMTPGAEGFGSRLVKSAIEGQLGGQMDRRFEQGGLAVDVEVPQSSIRS
ncbi:PAS domain-containing protein [Altererythrobacter aerius]|uniref:histidine kinase n=1 Tax=Tsuneonella aeria TaxID=1837929 RepID=A0A6I4TGB7_9SPHN|nr:GAF domain-containing protein [Tsuneonella aeria]MXO75676.1 PAS domain-containing protein [Tsuneonella aeria]